MHVVVLAGTELKTQVKTGSLLCINSEYSGRPATIKLLVSAPDTAAHGSYCYIQQPTHCSSGKYLAEAKHNIKTQMTSVLANK
jgi:hypothetical protein